MKPLRLIALVLLGAVAIWLGMKVLRPATIPLLSAEQMQVESPHFQLSLKHLEASKINQATVIAALQDARKDGEECDFLFATTCPNSGRLMYVLNVPSASDTQLVYAGSSDGTNLIAKAYWNGFGGWTKGP